MTMKNKTKTCIKCHIEKQLDCFPELLTSKDGFNNRCRKCLAAYARQRRLVEDKERVKEYKVNYKKKNLEKIRSSQNKYYENNKEIIAKRRKQNGTMLKSKYGLSISDYDKTLKSQNGLCAICGNPEITKNKNGEIKPLSVDHNHTSKKVRGLLCQKCNVVLGCSKESIMILENTISYIKKWSSE